MEYWHIVVCYWICGALTCVHFYITAKNLVALRQGAWGFTVIFWPLYWLVLPLDYLMPALNNLRDLNQKKRGEL